ncbi:MAG: membrane protein insertion efficiency factor YidD [bacterium]|nr:membrane protein insertion efficiency factor YidD [bacterium]
MMNPLQWLGIGLVRFYQQAISPWLAPSCKYYPSCSAYAIEAIKVQGFFRGAGLAIWRILRCNPWSSGGVDFPPGSTLEVPIPPDPSDSPDSPDDGAPVASVASPAAGEAAARHPHSHPHTPTGKQRP